VLRLVRVTHTSAAVKCRCGARIRRGKLAFELARVPPTFESLLGTRILCSVRCVHTFCLESLDILDPLDTPESRATILELRELHRRAHDMLATILSE